ncbi:Transposase [Caenorhabditis elegans]|uniref:Transposase n=1 Tax=Caenorhabditis elegans TaxID=6239 RepID=A1EHR1_CAEEL|nr:Transposase [Caenorhabditis elegans]CAL90890.1 Transposase [Caenorhabditis elegans]|eukprot:NP_001076715.1 Uncharacterized protein CELE_T28C6.10 [Caenorhabditis elegans]
MRPQRNSREDQLQEQLNKIKRELDNYKLENFLLKEELIISQSAILFVDDQNKKLVKKCQTLKKNGKPKRMGILGSFTNWIKSLF